MKYKYAFNDSLQEQFGEKIFTALVENYSKTFFVGGIARDMLLQNKIFDIDITTEATPEQIIILLQNQKIEYNNVHKKFGVITAFTKNCSVEITTLRTELYPTDSRYPHVTFITDNRLDSIRRDFTINALYYQHNANEISDFYNGLKDLHAGILKFIGDPELKIQEDPLRIIRAYRFQIQLNFNFEKNTLVALQKNMHRIKTISQNKFNVEIKKITDVHLQNKLFQVMHKNT